MYGTKKYTAIVMKVIHLSGAKNAALPLLATTLLSKNLYYFKNLPRINDIFTQLFILKQFNVSINWINSSSCFIDTTTMRIPSDIDYSQNTRGTYYFIGATAYLDSPLDFTVATGCEIDIRQIDFHIHLLRLLGKSVMIEKNKLFVSGISTATEISYTFPVPSVGSTINAILMFARSKAKATLYNYAKDPYIYDVIKLLHAMGAKIDIDPTCLIIHGSELNSEPKLIRHEIMTDPIEALTYIIFSGLTLPANSQSSYSIGPICRADYGDAVGFLESVGISLVDSSVADYCHVQRSALRPFTVQTGYFPGIYTDIQPFLTMLALYAEGDSYIKEMIWSDRFQYAQELVKLGYKIDMLSQSEICVHGLSHTTLTDTALRCTDLRGGMAILLLVRWNHMKNTLTKTEYIDRGYQEYETIIQTILRPDTEYHTDYPTAHLSNIAIGGRCKFYTEVQTKADLLSTIQHCIQHAIPYKIIGSGNNIYFADYYDGMIIQNNWCEIRATDTSIHVSSGTPLLDFVLYAAENGFDLSSLAGIPGTVGGSIYGNAGAYGTEIGDYLQECEIFDGQSIKVSTDMQMEYRSSYIKRNSSADIIVSAIFSKMPRGDGMANSMNVIALRNSRLPSENTLGSVFRNISRTRYAWQILDELGLRGTTTYGITSCQTHPNIFINTGSASPTDLTRLLDEIMQKTPLKLEIEYIKN
jgi:UDP-N-acetylglucosamine 1-carboxyvinyltransferase